MASTLAAAKTRKKRPGFVDAAKLAKNWKIGLEAAKRTVNSTAQSAVRDFSRHSGGGRRLKPEHWQKRQKRLNCTVFCDNFIGRCTSLKGNNIATIYATAFHHCFAKCKKQGSDTHFTLDDFFHMIGVPWEMVPDNAKKFLQGDFAKKCRRA